MSSVLYRNITAKNLHPTWNIMMIHYEIKNTIIPQQGDHKASTEYLRPTRLPEGILT